MMLFKYEIHLHTSEASDCAASSGAEMARAAKDAGYAGICVTDHHIGGNTCINRRLPFEEFVNEFFKGYENAKAEGDKIGLDVFPGWEAGFRGTEFIVLGLDKEWMLSHPELRDATVEEQYRLVKEGGGIVIHAHPFREERYLPEIRLYPQFVDAVEIINATHSNMPESSHYNREFNNSAFRYAKEHNLPMTAGSDIHSTKLLGGGMFFKKRMKSVSELTDAILNKEYVSLTDGKDTWTIDELESNSSLY